MTGNGAKTWTSDEKSQVEVCLRSAKMFDFQQIGVFFGLFDMVRGVEMESDAVVLSRS